MTQLSAKDIFDPNLVIYGTTMNSDYNLCYLNFTSRTCHGNVAYCSLVSQLYSLLNKLGAQHESYVWCVKDLYVETLYASDNSLIQTYTIRNSYLPKRMFDYDIP